MAGSYLQVDHAISLLKRRGRGSQRALQLELGVDDDALGIICDELVNVLEIADDTGSVLVARASSADPSGAVELRQVTVLMCDLVASTPLARQLVAEFMALRDRMMQVVEDEFHGRTPPSNT